MKTKTKKSKKVPVIGNRARIKDGEKSAFFTMRMAESEKTLLLEKAVSKGFLNISDMIRGTFGLQR